MHACTQALENYEQKSTASLCEILTIHTNIYVKNINLVLIQILFLLCFLGICSLLKNLLLCYQNKEFRIQMFIKLSFNANIFSLFWVFLPTLLTVLPSKKKERKQTETKTHTLTFTPPIILFTGSVLSCSFLKYFGVMCCPSLYVVIFFKTIKNNQTQRRKLFLKLKTV